VKAELAVFSVRAVLTIRVILAGRTDHVALGVSGGSPGERWQLRQLTVKRIDLLKVQEIGERLDLLFASALETLNKSKMPQPTRWLWPTRFRRCTARIYWDTGLRGNGAVTAYGDDERRRRASEYGAAEFITKPADFDFLKAALRRLSMPPVQ
jgi:hypothetical protein